MKNNLKISSMILNGKINLKRHLNESQIGDLIKRGELRWYDIQQKPMSISAELEGQGVNSHGKKNKVFVSLWPTGSITITGVKKQKEAEEIYQKVLKEIKDICPEVLENVY